MNAPICASMFIDYAKDYMSQYSLSMTQPDRDVVSAEKDCAVLAAHLALDLICRTKQSRKPCNKVCLAKAAEANPIYLEMQLHTHKLLKNLDLVRVIDSAQPEARHFTGKYTQYGRQISDAVEAKPRRLRGLCSGA